MAISLQWVLGDHIYSDSIFSVWSYPPSIATIPADVSLLLQYIVSSSAGCNCESLVRYQELYANHTNTASRVASNPYSVSLSGEFRDQSGIFRSRDALAIDKKFIFRGDNVEI
jgi:hypothetical protein